MRRTGGRSVSGLMSGQHVALVTTTGARSGQPREVPLLAIADGAALVLVASSWGREHNPAWYVNLVADRHVTVSIAGSTRAYVARTAAADERTRLWALADATYAGYRAYRSRARREIPLVVLEPT